MNIGRKYKPRELEWLVRRHCGFGCVFCGDMPTVYEHIELYSVVESHDFENMVLLCEKHHREVTSGRLPKNMVLDARKTPFAMSHEGKAKYEPLLQDKFDVRLGSIGITSYGRAPIYPIVVEGIAPITIELSPRVLFSLSIDDPDGAPAIRLYQNVFEFQPSGAWDVKLSGTKLVVRHARRKILLDVSISGGGIFFNVINMVVSNTAISFSKRKGLFIGSEKQQFQMSGINFAIQGNSPFVLINIGKTPISSFFRVEYLPDPTAKTAWNRIWPKTNNKKNVRH